MSQSSIAATSGDKQHHTGCERELHWWRWGLSVFGVVGVVALLYAEENWRGKRVWEQCKKDLELHGQTLDWAANVPPPMPDEENFFAAPNMAAWFAGRGQTYLSGKLSQVADKLQDTQPLLEVIAIRPNVGVVPDADLVLDYRDTVLTLPGDPGKPPTVRERAVIPVIVLSNAPLIDVVKNLTREDQLEFSVDPQAGFKESDPQPYVSGAWSNVTAHAALVSVLADYNLALVTDDKSGHACIVKRPTSGVYIPAEARAPLMALVQAAAAARTNGLEEPNVPSAQKLTTFLRSLPKTKPRRIVVRAEQAPEAREVELFFPTKVLSCLSGQSQHHAYAEAAGSNAFRIWVTPPPFAAAADYLAESEECQPEFELLQQALKRPYARIPGEYGDPITLPIPNFVTLRVVAQTLAQRAQCRLLLQQPEAAFRELKLLNQLCGILEARPLGKPMTVVAAMIHVALARLYVGVVADGLRMDGWREPQLAAIEAELSKMSLLPFVAAGFEMERASLCHVLERLTPEQSQLMYGATSTGLWDRIKDPVFVFLALAPRGWVYQNMATVVSRQQVGISSFNASRTLVLPYAAEAADRKFAQARSRFSPKSFLADNFLPNFIRAIQETARAQTLVNEAALACALERHRIARGSYPQKLEALSNIERIPVDVIGGQPLKYYLTSNHEFVLYSIGWNQKDDGGIPGSADINKFDIDQGDWVWPYRQRLIK